MMFILYGRSRLLWVTDLLLEDAHVPIAEMVELSSAAIKQILEHSFSKGK